MRRTVRQERPRSDAVVVREFFFPPGTPIPVVMAELGPLTTDEITALAAEIRSAT